MTEVQGFAPLLFPSGPWEPLAEEDNNFGGALGTASEKSTNPMREADVFLQGEDINPRL